MPSNRLNLGCGNTRLDGFLGVDLFPCRGMDVQHDLNLPLPFPDDSVEEVVSHHVIEHLRDPGQFLHEIHRVCRNGALVEIVTPHFASANSFIDITHLHHFSAFSLDAFCNDGCHYRPRLFTMELRRLTFSGHPLCHIGRFLAAISLRGYEFRWCYVFRPSNLRWRLRVIKAPADCASPGDRQSG